MMRLYNPVLFSNLPINLFSQKKWGNEFHCDNIFTNEEEFVEELFQNPGKYFQTYIRLDFSILQKVII